MNDADLLIMHKKKQFAENLNAIDYDYHSGMP